MADIAYEAYCALDAELTDIDSLIKGVACVREHQDDMHVEIDLLSLAEKKIAVSRELLKAMNSEYRRAVGKQRTEANTKDAPNKQAD